MNERVCKSFTGSFRLIYFEVLTILLAKPTNSFAKTNSSLAKTNSSLAQTNSSLAQTNSSFY